MKTEYFESGLISLNNVEHLKYIPVEHIKIENKALLSTVLQTLMASSTEGVDFRELEEKFNTHLHKPWRKLCQSSIREFIELELSSVVKISAEGKAK